jgi:hypothetical protein
MDQNLQVVGTQSQLEVSCLLAHFLFITINISKKLCKFLVLLHMVILHIIS